MRNFKQDFKRGSDLRHACSDVQRRRTVLKGFRDVQSDKSVVRNRQRSRRAGGGCVMRRCARTAAASTARRISAATPATARCSRRSAKILPRDAVWIASNLKRTHQTADAIWAAGFPKPADDAACGRPGRAASRRMAGHESRRVPGQPPGRQPLVCRRSTSPRRAARVSWISTTACARDRAHHRRACRQEHHRSRPWRRHQGRDRSGARRPAGARGSPSTSTIAR